MRAIFAASATTAISRWLRADSPRDHDPMVVSVLAGKGMADHAPWISILRRDRLPRFVIPIGPGLPRS